MTFGLALGGGAARGYAHIGFLEVLSEEGIEFDVVSGTSIGALVGAVYCAGKLADLKAAVLAVSVLDIPRLLSPAWSLGGLFSGASVLDLLSEIVGVQSIEQLAKPFAAATVEVTSGQLCILDHGPLAQAIRASIALPGLFTPTVIDDRLYIDGGVAEPIPVEAARRLGADRVLAVDLFGKTMPQESRTRSKRLSALHHLQAVAERLGVADKLAILAPTKRQRPVSAIYLLQQTLALTQARLTELRLQQIPADLVVRLPVADFGSLDFHLAEQAIELGRTEAREQLPAIRALMR